MDAQPQQHAKESYLDESFTDFVDFFTSNTSYPESLDDECRSYSYESYWPPKTGFQDTNTGNSPPPNLFQEDLIAQGIMSDFDGLPLPFQAYEPRNDISVQDFPSSVSPSLLQRSQTFPQYIEHPIGTSDLTFSGDSEKAAELRCAKDSAPVLSLQECTATSPRERNVEQEQETQPKKLRPCDIKNEKRKVDKPEICHICSRGFAQARDLRRHIAVHERSRATHLQVPVERFHCVISSCHQTFARQDHLTRHLRNKHGR
ncbi:hypothetical protein BJ170DRAFT_596264 [Xylariales sp. AK1849]|nr:hypothetical protein BJ170DRAFT_596264 [Xylariales sp. AK1849]